jgi:hypothetical protein
MMCSSAPMSTSPDNAIVNLLSEWLAFGAGADELRTRLGEIDRSGLDGEAGEAVFELVTELETASPNGRGHLERLVRETLDAVALG